MWNDAWAHPGMAGWGMAGWGPAGWSDNGWWWSMIGAHGLVWLVIVVLVATALAVLLRGRRRDARSRDATAILEARYARGEIDRGEYLERTRDLS